MDSLKEYIQSNCPELHQTLQGIAFTDSVHLISHALMYVIEENHEMELVKLYLRNPMSPRYIIHRSSIATSIINGNQVISHAPKRFVLDKLFSTGLAHIAMSIIKEGIIPRESLNQYWSKEQFLALNFDGYVTSTETPERINSNKLHPLIMACAVDNVSYVKEKMKSNFFPATRSILPHMLRISINTRSNECTDLLLKNKDCFRNFRVVNHVHVCIEVGDYKNLARVIESVKEYGTFNPNHRDRDGDGYLAIAIYHEQQKCSKILIECLAEGINTPNKDGNTPLMILTDENPKLESVRDILLEHPSVDISHVNEKGKNLLGILLQDHSYSKFHEQVFSKYLSQDKKGFCRLKPAIQVPRIVSEFMANAKKIDKETVKFLLNFHNGETSKNGSHKKLVYDVAKKCTPEARDILQFNTEFDPRCKLKYTRIFTDSLDFYRSAFIFVVCKLSQENIFYFQDNPAMSRFELLTRKLPPEMVHRICIMACFNFKRSRWLPGDFIPIEALKEALDVIKRFRMF